MSSYNEQYTPYQYTTTATEDESSDDESYSEDDYTSNSRPRQGVSSRGHYAAIGGGGNPVYGAAGGSQYGGVGGYGPLQRDDSDVPSGPCTVSGKTCNGREREKERGIYSLDDTFKNA